MNLDLDAKVEAHKVTFGGKPYTVRPLKVWEQTKMHTATKGLDESTPEFLEAVLGVIAGCGIPVEQLKEMSGPQLEAVMGVLSGKK